MTKLILITGATAGIGKATARELAAQGQHVIIHGRNKQKAQKVVAEIKQATGNQHISYLIADLFSMTAIKEMAARFNAKYDHLDVLINNAGAVLDDRRFETADGIEGTMALNVFAPLLLTELLLPQLRKSQDARVINMSSGTHRMAHSDMDDLNLEHVSSGQTRYGISKLFVIWNTQHLAAHLQRAGITNVTVNASHPGMATTNFGQSSDNGFWNNLVYKVALAIGKTFHIATPEQGAVTNVYLATDDAVKGVSGEFFNNKKQQVQPATGEYTPARELALWKYCMAKLQPWIDEN